jgi:nitrogen fixation protein FixH
VSAPAQKTRVRSGRWIPWTFVGMFGIILAVNGTMVALALDTWSGLSTTEPYRRGLMHDRQLAEVEREQKLGWKVSGGFKQTRPGGGVIELRALDRDGRPILGAKVVARVVRPVVEGSDFTVTLPGRGAGLYTADVAFPKRGLWELRYRVVGNGDKVSAIHRIRVK